MHKCSLNSFIKMDLEAQIVDKVTELKKLAKRYCQQIEQGMWAIADVSIDYSRVNQFVTPSCSRGLPSGCLIHDMPNGYSKITWMEHVEIEEKSPIHQSYRELINGGMAFETQRWVTTLQRMCERLACLMVTGASTRDLGGGTHGAFRKVVGKIQTLHL